MPYIFPKDKSSVLLMVLPFLTPLLPPVGISCIKSYLERRGFTVNTADGMADMELREAMYTYFDSLKEFIPEPKRGHFFNVGLDVLGNHLMAHANRGDEELYTDLVKQLVAQNFFVDITTDQTAALATILDTFYLGLERYLIELMERRKPGLVGLSVYKGTLGPSVFAARLLKERFPDVKVVMGGTIFSQELFPGSPNFDRFVSSCPQIDHLFIGESEELFLRFLEGRLPDGDKKTFTLHDVGDRLLDLDTLEIPDYSDFDVSLYPVLGAFTSRGCVYRCSFCAETLYWKQYNRKSAKKVADDLVALSRRYGKQVFVLTDCLVNPIVNELSSDLADREANLYWDVYLKVDKQVCDPQLTHLWRRGGFYRARLGVESGSQRILDIIKKGITVEQIKQALANLADAGIKTTTYWIAGHPGETEADFQQTLDLLEELRDYIFEAECDPFRYFFNGQVNGDSWARDQGNQSLYPDSMDQLLMAKTYALNAQPDRREIYRRQCLFRQHCIRLGIPNPYSVREIVEADQRWRRLHQNAVPPLLTLNKDGGNNGEVREVKQFLPLDKPEPEDVDFCF